MTSKIGDETTQLSARVDVKDFERIDRIRDDLKKRSGIKPQRSEVIRMVLYLGFDAYDEQKKVAKADEKKPAAKAEKEKRA